MSTLLELSAEARELSEALLALEEAADDAEREGLEAAVEARLGELLGQLGEKVDAYAALIEEHEARAEVLRAHAERFQRAARANENAAKRLKERLLLAMEGMGADKLAGEVYQVAVAQGPWRVEVLAEEPVLDAGYVRTSVEVDKQGLLRDWRRDPRLVEGLPVQFTRSRYVRVKP